VSLTCQRCSNPFDRRGSRGPVPKLCPPCAEGARLEQARARAASAKYPRSDRPKVCSKCERTLPASMFASQARNRDGLQPHCRECKRAYHVASYTPEKRAAMLAKQRAKAPDGYKKQKRQYARKWRETPVDRRPGPGPRSRLRRAAFNSPLFMARAFRERWAADPAYRARKALLKRGSYLRNREKVLQQQRIYNTANAARRSEWHRAWRERNAERKRSTNRAHYEKNKGRYYEYSAARRAAKLNATPDWCEHQAIAAFYAACPTGFHVDHIVPLQSQFVCGLHCLANLQYLPAKENASKRNYRWPDMPQLERRAA
jgi:hypothetical protein